MLVSPHSIRFIKTGKFLKGNKYPNPVKTKQKMRLVLITEYIKLKSYKPSHGETCCAALCVQALG